MDFIGLPHNFTEDMDQLRQGDLAAAYHVPASWGNVVVSQGAEANLDLSPVADTVPGMPERHGHRPLTVDQQIYLFILADRELMLNHLPVGSVAIGSVVGPDGITIAAGVAGNREELSQWHNLDRDDEADNYSQAFLRSAIPGIGDEIAKCVEESGTLMQDRSHLLRQFGRAGITLVAGAAPEGLAWITTGNVTAWDFLASAVIVGAGMYGMVRSEGRYLMAAPFRRKDTAMVARGWGTAVAGDVNQLFGGVHGRKTPEVLRAITDGSDG